MKDYLVQANEGVVTFAMIETCTAIGHLEAILQVPGIDAVFIGPSDLSVTLSDGKVLDPHSKQVDEAINKIAAAAKKAGKIAGAYTANSERANELAKTIPGAVIPGQFDNPANPLVHEKTTAEEIWNDTKGKVDAIAWDRLTKSLGLVK